MRTDAALVEKFAAPSKVISTATNMPVDNDLDPLMHGAAGPEMLAELDERLTEEICLDGAKRGYSDIALLPVVR